MPREIQATLALNRGVLSQLALARVDIARYKMAAATMVNWMARVLGSMMLRPGSAYITSTYNNLPAKTIPFVFGATDTARVEVTQGQLRVLVNDVPVTRGAVTAAVTNGTFISNFTGWTNDSESGASVTWQANSQVAFVGTGTSDAILDQQVAVNEVGKEHALRIVITRGHFLFRVGTSEGDDTYINEQTLYAGTHSLTFTPTGSSFWIRFAYAGVAEGLLASCVVEASGVMVLPAPWQTSDFPNMRWVQSGDVLYVGCVGYQQRMIQRRAVDAWSIVLYAGLNGPFRAINATQIALTPSGLTGDITLTSSKPFFKPGHVGALFQLTSTGQTVQASLAAANTFTNAIRVNGVGSQRLLNIVISGTFTGTLQLQYSVAAPGTWIDVTGESWTGPATATYNDGLDNQVIYYRIGFEATYSAGTAVALLSFASGSITGTVQVTGYTDNEHVSAAVIGTPSTNPGLPGLGATSATTDWSEGAWSPYRGYPATPCFFQGRLWWFGSSIFASVSDDYENFDATVIGDSGPIIGQLDSGPVENFVFALALQQLVVGNATNETSIRSTYLGDPVTPTNFNVISSSSQGSANVAALQMDSYGIFVQVSTQRVYELQMDVYTYAYRSQELTVLVPDFNSAGIVAMAIQRKPDTRLHCVRTDGTVGVMVYDPAENVNCWLAVATAAGGKVIDVNVLPGIAEDQVYYTIQRTIEGATVTYHEKFAQETECTGLPVAKCLDSHVVYAGAAVSTLPQIAPHLEGLTVSVWGWNTVNPYIDGNGNQPGLDLGTYTVAEDGTVEGLTFNGAAYPVTNAIVGLPYTAQWQSMKQAFAAGLGTPLNQRRRIDRLGLILSNTHAQGLLMGNDFQHLDSIPLADLPTITQGDDEPADENAILVDYDFPMSAFDDIWSTDSRVCLQAASPRPCTALAFSVAMTTNT